MLEKIKLKKLAKEKNMHIKWKEDLWQSIILKESQKETEEKKYHRQVEENSFYDYKAQKKTLLFIFPKCI